jgi:hypothetical protein
VVTLQGGAEMNSKRYSDDEAREILKRAVEYQDQSESHYTRDQLLDIGREMGLSEDAIVKAEQAHLAKKGIETPVVLAPTPLTTYEIPVEAEEMAFRRHRIQEFRQNLTSYAIIIPFLFLLNLFTTGFDPLWAIYPALGWGIGVLFHYFSSRQTEGDDYEKQFDEWLDKRATRIRKRRRRLEE